ncbi:MAG: hypothetical protein ABI358_09615 [Ginsengibacter sp.]
MILIPPGQEQRLFNYFNVITNSEIWVRALEKYLSSARGFMPIDKLGIYQFNLKKKSFSNNKLMRFPPSQVLNFNGQ